MLPPCEASPPTFAPLVVEHALEERQTPAIKLEIAIGDVVLRTDTAIDGEQLSRVIRAVRASRRSRPVRISRFTSRRGQSTSAVATMGHPFSGAVFVFRSKRADRIKILVWDRTGLVLVHKRLLKVASSFGQRSQTA